MALLRPRLLEKNPETGQVRLDESGIPTARRPPPHHTDTTPQTTKTNRTPQRRIRPCVTTNASITGAVRQMRLGAEGDPLVDIPRSQRQAQTSASISHARTPHIDGLV